MQFTNIVHVHWGGGHVQTLTHTSYFIDILDIKTNYFSDLLEECY